MANSELRGKKWKIPKEMLLKLFDGYRKFNGNKKSEGYVRMRNLLKEKEITYENMKNFVHFFSKNKDNPELYELSGGVDFENWISNRLGTSRKRLDHKKDAEQEMGKDNSHIKSHEKDFTDKGKPKMPKLYKSMSSKDVRTGNVNYENKNIKKIVINENQYKKIITENNEEKVISLLKSKQLENVKIGAGLVDMIGGAALEFYNGVKEICLLSSSSDFTPELFHYMYNHHSIIIYNKELDTLPSSIGYFVNMKGLYLRKNNLKALPAILMKLNNLENIILNDNAFSEIPNVVSSLPNLKKLHMRRNYLDFDDVSKFKTENPKIEFMW